MAAPKSAGHRGYIRYAENLIPATSARDDRAVNRKMAAEWLRLADAIAHPLKPDAIKAALKSRRER